jgi:hypothetical protein
MSSSHGRSHPESEDGPPTKRGQREHGFAPQDLTDGRAVGEYLSRYENRIARRGIAFEAVYVGALLILAPICMVVVFFQWIRFDLPTTRYEVFAHYSYAWLGGMLGGTLFSVKWLYHSVAHGTWHQDRRLWRLFTPHLSAGLAFSVVVLMESGILAIFDAKTLADARAVVGMTFLVGYFSDSVVAKLAEIARNLFGDSKANRAEKPKVAESDAKNVSGSQQHDEDESGKL